MFNVIYFLDVWVRYGRLIKDYSTICLASRTMRSIFVRVDVVVFFSLSAFSYVAKAALRSFVLVCGVTLSDFRSVNACFPYVFETNTGEDPHMSRRSPNVSSRGLCAVVLSTALLNKSRPHE